MIIMDDDDNNINNNNNDRRAYNDCGISVTTNNRRRSSQFYDRTAEITIMCTRCTQTRGQTLVFVYKHQWNGVEVWPSRAVKPPSHRLQSSIYWPVTCVLNIVVLFRLCDIVICDRLRFGLAFYVYFNCCSDVFRRLGEALGLYMCVTN